MKIGKYIPYLMLIVSQFSGAQSRLNGLERIDAITIDEHIVAGKDSDVSLDYYSGKKEVSGNSITYTVEKEDRSYINDNQFSYRIYNKRNVLSRFPYLSSRFLSLSYVPSISTDTNAVESIVRGSISASKINTLSYYGGGIIIYIKGDSKTGDVLEVEFVIHATANQKKDPRMISPEELEKMEKSIKSKIKYSVPEQYEDNSFIHKGCCVNFMPELRVSQ